MNKISNLKLQIKKLKFQSKVHNNFKKEKKKIS